MLFVKNQVQVIKAEEPAKDEGTTFADLRNSLTEKTVKEKKNQFKAPAKVLEQPTPAPTVSENINKDTIRPSHIKSEHILYKSSGYLKDLIGEEK
jgi:hypothetical protein